MWEKNVFSFGTETGTITAELLECQPNAERDFPFYALQCSDYITVPTHYVCSTKEGLAFAKQLALSNLYVIVDRNLQRFEVKDEMKNFLQSFLNYLSEKGFSKPL